jgi:Protein of unknown function (DUF5672)
MQIVRNKDKNLAAIAVPLAEKPDLTDEEKISIKHLETYLGHFDRYLIQPQGMNFTLRGFKVMKFARNFFGSLLAHRSLLFSEIFYKKFENYKFVLIYHTDALVFSDNLSYWCGKNYDYIGPPWIPHKEAPYAGNPNFEGKVGNGGFSLRKVDSFLKVINSKKYWKNPVYNLFKVYRENSGTAKVKRTIKSLQMFIPHLNGVKQEMISSRMKDHLFWADRAAHYYPPFRIAPLDEALRFGFECVPRYCYKVNDFKLPFGCHAWEKYDRAFWEDHLLA